MMKRRILSLLLIAVMVLGMCPAAALAAPAESGGVYQIGTAEELLWFAETVNGGSTAIQGTLTVDIGSWCPVWRRCPRALPQRSASASQKDTTNSIRIPNLYGLERYYYNPY